MYSVKNLPEEVHSLREERGCGYEMKDVLQLLLFSEFAQV